MSKGVCKDMESMKIYPLYLSRGPISGLKRFGSSADACFILCQDFSFYSAIRRVFLSLE